MTTDFSLRPMEPACLPQVAELGRGCFTLPWSEAGYRSLLESSRGVCLTAWAGTELAGFLCGSVLLDEGELELLAVAEPFRRQGAARALTRSFLSQCASRGAELIRLEVRASNAGAARLYESLGFRQTGIRKNYYRLPPEDALLYIADLSQREPPPEDSAITPEREAPPER